MRISLALCLLLFCSGPVFAQATDVPLLIEGCQGCHGAAGQGGHGIPAIEGTHSRDEFAALMRAHYKPQENIMALSRRAFLAAATLPATLAAPRCVARLKPCPIAGDS